MPPAFIEKWFKEIQNHFLRKQQRSMSNNIWLPFINHITNKMAPESYLIETEEFELPFLKKNHRAYVDGVKNKKRISDKIPESAIFLGGFDGTFWANSPFAIGWNYYDDFYIIPLSDGEFNWALFRVSWDDNSKAWILIPSARISGDITSFKNAALLMLGELMSKWGRDSDDPITESLLELLEHIEGMKEK